MTKKEVENLLKKHFGEVENKEEFMNDLFDKNENYLIKGSLKDTYGKLTDEISNAFSFDVSVKIMGESFFVTVYNPEHEDYDDSWSGVNFWYYHQKNDDDTLIFSCDSKGTESEFTLSDDYGSVNTPLSVNKIRQLIKTELCIKHLFKLQR